MKSSFFFVTGFVLADIICFGQSRIDSLNYQRKARQDHIAKIEAEIRTIDAEILELRRQSILNSADILIKAKCGGSVGCYILSEPSTSGHILKRISVGEDLEISGNFLSNEYLKAKYKGVAGYMYYGVLEKTPELTKLLDVIPNTSRSPSSSEPSRISNETYQSGNNSSQSNNYHSIETGPRGGKYYINSKGKKTYVKKK